jgi:hypothetical protein
MLCTYLRQNSTYTAFKRMINSLRKLAYNNYIEEQSVDSMQSRTLQGLIPGCLASIRRRTGFEMPGECAA